MSAANFSQHRVRWQKAQTPESDPTAADVHRGWEDVRCGRPFPRDYDRWERVRQNNYEAGRRCAALLRAHLPALPEWPRNLEFNQMLPELPSQACANDWGLENTFTMGVVSR